MGRKLSEMSDEELQSSLDKYLLYVNAIAKEKERRMSSDRRAKGVEEVIVQVFRSESKIVQEILKEVQTLVAPLSVKSALRDGIIIEAQSDVSEDSITNYRKIISGIKSKKNKLNPQFPFFEDDICVPESLAEVMRESGMRALA